MRPDWNKVMKDCGGAYPDDNGLVVLTRGTARLAASALRAQNASDYYHNYSAAEHEVLAVLARPAPTPMQQLDNLVENLGECEHYCASHSGGECNCGGWWFRRPDLVAGGRL